MTIHAYPDAYLSKAQNVLGEAFDYAINSYGISGDDFIKLFVISRESKHMENGDADYILGRSGIEVAIDIIREATGEMCFSDAGIGYMRTAEYWAGWAVSYYQWYSGRKYSDIFEVFNFEDLISMYHVLHEADISRFADIADARMHQCFAETNLKRIRICYGCSQAELAAMSGVSLRSIQMYEQRNKDINKACAITLYRLSKALGCTMEDLIER